MPVSRFAGRTAIAACAATLLLAGAGPAAAQETRKPLNPYGQRFIELFDTNHDGKVSLAEVTADQGRLFGAIDIDGDKKLSIDEIRRRGRFLQMWRTTTLFDLLDVNGDGVLTVDEINAPTARWFKRYDINGDGVMDTSEIPDRSRGWDKKPDR